MRGSGMVLVLGPTGWLGWVRSGRSHGGAAASRVSPGCLHLPHRSSVVVFHVKRRGWVASQCGRSHPCSSDRHQHGRPDTRIPSLGMGSERDRATDGTPDRMHGARLRSGASGRTAAKGLPSVGDPMTPRAQRAESRRQMRSRLPRGRAGVEELDPWSRVHRESDVNMVDSH